ncbi:(Fe-S)-binding protein [Carboxydocella sp. ULO1]|uniref:(Fe-S)-binding protein n=1 Tax=Carboxydocella sp. ULO1 TaxID=1926599 RepID=UPI0009ABFB84|nr:(Fe-S)-binding protein [Carboxydocella sp. ULO1]GAW28396.1 hypothetical protein ULO1_09660 [Carboxydocella sp. ULO1]
MATLYDDLQQVKPELAKCMKCGNCMAVCPIYITEKTEAGVARGKITLAEALLAGDLDLQDEDLIHKLFNCLVCKSCMQNCPCGVKFDRIILALRAEIARQKGLHPLKKAIFAALKKQGLFDLGMRLGGSFQGLVFRRHPEKKAYYPRFRMGLSMKRILPALAPVPFRSQVPSRITGEPKGERPVRVAFFTGCSINYIYPQIGHDVIEVLKENGVEVVIPRDQCCCGIATFVHGDVATARELARKNLEAFSDCGADYIITACGSCGGSWQHEFKELLGDDPIYGPKAEYWSSRTYDISTFLTRVINYRKPQGEINVTVTYHDPCHLKKTMKVYQEPREILRAIPGVELKEMNKPDACCGSGGSFSLTHYETSMEINQRKIADASQTGAEEVITGCPACMMHLADGINQFGKGQEVVHYISLLAESYRKEKGGK